MDATTDLQEPVGGLVRPAQHAAAPRRHRRVPVALVVAGALELHKGHSELGGEGRVALGDLDHRLAVRRDHEGIDRFGEPQLHPDTVHQFDPASYPQDDV
jgi:hypothetical protein